MTADEPKLGGRFCSTPAIVAIENENNSDQF
jgi:hypothetical protein